MTIKITLVAAATAAALAVGAPAALAQTRSPDAHDRSAAVSPGDQAVAYFRANELETAARSAQTDLAAYADAGERAEPASADALVPRTTASDSTIDPTQIGIGFGIGILLSLGLLLGLRRMPSRPLTH